MLVSVKEQIKNVKPYWFMNHMDELFVFVYYTVLKTDIERIKIPITERLKES